MKRLLGTLLVAGFAAGMTAGSTQIVLAEEDAYGTKKSEPVYYSGDYPPAYCYSDPTYEPPKGYLENCEPPKEWVAYCEYTYPTFTAYNGYYKADDGYWRYCGQ